LVIKQYRYPTCLYYGEWSTKLTKENGRGIMVWNNSRYEGYFKNGSYMKGKLYDINGNFFDAEYFCQKVHGYGSAIYNSSITYIGYFKNGLQDGKGKETFSDGSCYKGDFKEGKRHGLGRHKYPNGDIYEGWFKNGFPEGKGILTYSNGNRYEGDFKDGKKHGYGRLISINGIITIGQYRKGKMFGKSECVC
jgi:hypothetical protein